MGDEFVPVLVGVGQREAKPSLERWLITHQVTVDDIGADNIRLELGRAEGGKDFWRWRIRSTVIARLGLPALPPRDH